MPSYYFRRILERWYVFLNRNKLKLNYAEIKYLKNKVDVVHIQHSFLFPKVLGLLNMPKELRPKIVITLRGADTYVKPWVNKKWSDFYKNFGNTVDSFIVMSQNQKAYLQKWGVEKERIQIVPISFGSFSYAEPRYPNSKVIKIISAFRMCWEKNIDANIRIVKKLVDRGYHVQYDIFGDGQDLGQAYYLIDKFNLDKSIKCHGKIENKEFKELLPNYDFYLQLSLSESAGVSVIEAQSKGVPVIVSDSDGLPEMVVDNKTGFVLPYYDVIGASNKIISLFNDEEKYFKFSKKAIEFVNSKFSVERETASLLDLYNNLIND